MLRAPWFGAGRCCRPGSRRLTRSFYSQTPLSCNVPQTHAVVPPGTIPPSATLNPAPLNLRSGHIPSQSDFSVLPGYVSLVGAPMGPFVGPIGAKTAQNAPKGPASGPLRAPYHPLIATKGCLCVGRESHTHIEDFSGKERWRG